MIKTNIKNLKLYLNRKKKKKKVFIALKFYDLEELVVVK